MPGLLGTKLRSLRSERSLSQTQLSQQLSLATQSHISYLEAGHALPSTELLLQIADLFGVTTDYLLRDDTPVDAALHTEAPTPSQSPSGRLFGRKLRHLRRQRKLTQLEVAQDLGLASHSHLSFLETDRKEASLDLVVRIAALFHVTTDYLLRDSIPIDASAESLGGA